MRVETPQIGLTQIHQELARSREIPGFLEICGFHDGIGIRVLRILSGEDLLHLELGTRTAGNDGPGPLLDRFALLPPILFRRVPVPLRRQLQRNQAQGFYLQPTSLHVSRNIGMARIPPLFAGYYGNGLRGHRVE
jgi:hypothetical protein